MPNHQFSLQAGIGKIPLVLRKFETSKIHTLSHAGAAWVMGTFLDSFSTYFYNF